MNSKNTIPISGSMNNTKRLVSYNNKTLCLDYSLELPGFVSLQTFEPLVNDWHYCGSPCNKNGCQLTSI
jgi:hypothetical protein